MRIQEDLLKEVISELRPEGEKQHAGQTPGEGVVVQRRGLGIPGRETFPVTLGLEPGWGALVSWTPGKRGEQRQSDQVRPDQSALGACLQRCAGPSRARLFGERGKMGGI